MNRPIGVIDSGVGGLTVAHEIMRQLPNETLIYLGDTLRCPYGSRTEQEINQYTNEMVTFLLKRDIKMLIIACNTATAFTLERLKKTLSIPVIGVVKPGARAAIKKTVHNAVGVIGTEATVYSRAYEKALKTIKPNIYVESLACPMLVPMVEQGILSGSKAKDIVRQSLSPMIKTKKIDTLVLGCTHYPLLKQTIKEVMGEDIYIISSSDETAQETSMLLEVHGLLQKKTSSTNHMFYTTGNLDLFKQITNRLFKINGIDIRKAVIQE